MDVTDIGLVTGGLAGGFFLALTDKSKVGQFRCTWDEGVIDEGPKETKQ